MNQNILNWIVASFGALVTYAFGGWSDLLVFFLIVIAVDYISGVFASLKEGKGLNSNVGFWGLVKKGLMLVMIMIAHRIDLITGSSIVMNGAICFYLANEMISVTENYGRLGLPLPKQIKKFIDVLKDKEDVKSTKRKL